MGTRLSILILAFGLASAHAAEVLRVGKDMTNIAVSHDTTRTWVAGDRVCVLQHAREVGCGSVLKTTTKGAIVRLDAASYDILAGDKVISKFQAPTAAAPQNRPRSVQQQQQAAPQGAPLMNSVGDSAESEIHSLNISGGVLVGTSFFYPSLSAQWAITPELAIGITGSFITYTDASLSTLTAFGGMATLNYYSQEYYRGLWVQGGAGVTYLSSFGLYGPESATCMTGLATVGWRGYWDLGLNIGVGAGFQYTVTPAFVYTTVSSTGFQPVLVLDVGFSFF